MNLYLTDRTILVIFQIFDDAASTNYKTELYYKVILKH